MKACSVGKCSESSDSNQYHQSCVQPDFLGLRARCKSSSLMLSNHPRGLKHTEMTGSAFRGHIPKGRRGLGYRWALILIAAADLRLCSHSGEPAV